MKQKHKLKISTDSILLNAPSIRMLKVITYEYNTLILSKNKTNFRSQSKIIDLSNYVITLMEALFPFSLDKLEQEESQNDGCHSVFLARDHDLGALMKYIRKREGSPNFTFLVRTNEAKATLNRLLGAGMIIFTIYESKVSP